MTYAFHCVLMPYPNYRRYSSSKSRAERSNKNIKQKHNLLLRLIPLLFRTCVCITFTSRLSGFPRSSGCGSPHRWAWRSTDRRRMVWGGHSGVYLCHSVCSCSSGPQDIAHVGWHLEGSREGRRRGTSGREAHSYAGSRKTSQTGPSDWCPGVQEAELWDPVQQNTMVSFSMFFFSMQFSVKF